MAAIILRTSAALVKGLAMVLAMAMSRPGAHQYR
jgi:hypothetical protein